MVQPKVRGRGGNKARRDAFIDILVETKEMLRYLHPALLRVQRDERREGAPAMMKKAAYAIISEYHIAHTVTDVESKTHHIEQMIGAYGVLQSAFEVSILQGLFPDGFKLPIAERMARIEEGIRKWYNAQSSQRQARAQCPVGTAVGGVGAVENSELKGARASFTPSADAL